jgi:hypothetical protein
VVGFIIRKFVMMPGHMNIKFNPEFSNNHIQDALRNGSGGREGIFPSRR